MKQETRGWPSYENVKIPPETTNIKEETTNYGMIKIMANLHIEFEFRMLVFLREENRRT